MLLSLVLHDPTKKIYCEYPLRSVYILFQVGKETGPMKDADAQRARVQVVSSVSVIT